MAKEWSNIAKVTYKRTYAREIDNKQENWEDTINRVVNGNLNLVDPKYILPNEKEILTELHLNRKMTLAGRGLWFSGAENFDKIGGAALVNCWVTVSDNWENFVMAQDLLMLGGGVGLSVEHRFTSKLPKVKENVEIIHKDTKDADFIVPDSRDGWCELTRQVLEAFFVTGKSFSYSTICLRGAGEKIKGFGGKASGPLPLISFIKNLNTILNNRANKHIRPIDAADILCTIGDMVVAGNIRRSAIMILGDPWDKEYLKAKRWDLGNIPNYRSRANFSVICDDIEDLHSSFWKTYEVGEPFGIFNRKNGQRFGRMGEKKKDVCVAPNPCGEALLSDGEPCNLVETFLPNLLDESEFQLAARMAARAAIRVTCAKYHNPKNQKAISENRRIGISITGCLQSPLFKPEILDKAYNTIQEEVKSYCKELNIPECIRTTVVKPSGTLSIVGDCTAGIHAAYSKYYIRRIRFASTDPLLDILREAGHFMEPEKRFDGTLNRDTMVVDFYVETPEGTPCVDEGFDTWKQLDVLKMAQKHWADQAVSVTVYYKKEEIPLIKKWLEDNLGEIKTVSFLMYTGHGFVQAPIEPITKEQYEKSINKIKPLQLEKILVEEAIDSLECEGGSCPIK